MKKCDLRGARCPHRDAVPAANRGTWPAIPARLGKLTKLFLHSRRRHDRPEINIVKSCDGVPVENFAPTSAELNPGGPAPAPRFVAYVWYLYGGMAGPSRRTWPRGLRADRYRYLARLRLFAAPQTARRGAEGGV